MEMRIDDARHGFGDTGHGEQIRGVAGHVCGEVHAKRKRVQLL